MTKYVFTTDDGRVPDLRFAGGQTSCTNGPTGGSSCHVEGELTIRDTRRPFAIDLKVDRSGQSFRASGDGVVLLSTYGIERPSQLGVTTRDEVRLHLEFTAAPVTSVPASGGAR